MIRRILSLRKGATSSPDTKDIIKEMVKASSRKLLSPMKTAIKRVQITSPVEAPRTVETNDQSVMVTLIDDKPTVSEEERQKFLDEKTYVNRSKPTSRCLMSYDAWLKLLRKGQM